MPKCAKCGQKRKDYVEVTLWNPTRGLTKPVLLCTDCAAKYTAKAKAAEVATWN